MTYDFDTIGKLGNEVWTYVQQNWPALKPILTGAEPELGKQLVSLIFGHLEKTDEGKQLVESAIQNPSDRETKDKLRKLFEETIVSDPEFARSVSSQWQQLNNNNIHVNNNDSEIKNQVNIGTNMGSLHFN